MTFGIEQPPSVVGVSFPRWLMALWTFLRSTYAVKTVTSAYTVEQRIHYVRANATGGAFAVTLPSADINIGRQIIVKKIDASGNAVTVSRSGSDTIEGSNTVSLGSQWDDVILIAGASGSWERL